MSLDENEAVFTRRAPALDDAVLNRLVGTYITPSEPGVTLPVSESLRSWRQNVVEE